MKLINARSPYVIEVNEATSDGSKLEVFLWNPGSTEPPAVWLPSTAYVVNDKVSYNDNYYNCTIAGTSGTTPPTHTTGAAANGTATFTFTGNAVTTNTKVYTLSKNNPSTTQKSTQYNISNLTRDYINNVFTSGANSFAVELVGNWAWVRVKRYNLIGVAYTLLDNTLYGAENGYSGFMSGLNTAYTVTTIPLVLGSSSITYKVKDNATNYVNIFAPAGTWNYTNVTTGDNTNIVATDFTLFRFPIKNGENKFTDVGSATLYFTIVGVTENEAKYTPVVCRFLNRYGGWDFITFYKAKTFSTNTTSNNYKVLPSALNYNPLLGQNKLFNINGQLSVKLNTGWIDEECNVQIQDLLLSEFVYLDNVPVVLKTKGTDIKTSLQNKNINYEMEFDYAFNSINDQV